MTTKTYILDDLPAQRDALDFQPYIDTLADVISSPNTQTPLTIGVFGGWGSGKTTLMGLVEKGLPANYRTAWFDAWKYERENDLWRALLLTVLDALETALPKNDAGEVDTEAKTKLDDLRTCLYRPVEREEMGGLQVDWGKLAGGVGQGALQLGLSFVPGASTLSDMVKALQKEGAIATTEKIIESIGRERSQIFIQQVQFLEQFQREFRDLVEAYILEKNHRLVVFVDDLDRCLPEKAVEVLEAIKLFLDVPGCVFMLGLDDKVIARGVEIKYRQAGLTNEETDTDREQRLIEGTRYLEKIIQLPFKLPPIAQEDMQSFVEGLIADWEHEECPRVFAAGLGGNPRQVKRTVNTFLLLYRLAEKRDGNINAVRLAKVVTIQNVLPRLYEFLKKYKHRYLRELEIYFMDEAAPAMEKMGRGEEKASVVEPPQALTPFLRQRGIAAVRQVLTLHPDQEEYNFRQLTPEELRVYFTLTRRAEAPQIESELADLPQATFEPQLETVPDGPFLMGTTKEQARQLLEEGFEEELIRWEVPQHTVKLSAYQIGKYPVTNQEYQAFIQESDLRPPTNWDGDQYPEGKGDHPVVYVSWLDAQAYCRWLSKKTGKNYRLPTEAEWEKAARGEDGRVYPWGDEWSAKKCNCNENGIDDTTPVGQYSPQGDSTYGCADMAGNVWEWCADRFDEEEYQRRTKLEEAIVDPQGPKEGDYRVLRGGAFVATWSVRCASRNWSSPFNWNCGLGFRVVASPLPRRAASEL